MPDKIVVIKMKGSTFKQALENGVSAWPKYDGRFPSISGCRFSFDPRKEPGQRINLEDIEAMSGPLDPNKVYKVAIKAFIAEGKDGYNVFKGNVTYVIEEDNAVLIQDLIYQFFDSLSPNYLPMGGVGDRIREERMRLFNTDENNIGENGFIRINPQCDGRIVNISDLTIDEE